MLYMNNRRLHQRKCSVEKCEEYSYCRGFCGNHYRRFIKHGNPLGGLYCRRGKNILVNSFIVGNTGFIELTKNQYAMVDAEDFEKVSRHMWICWDYARVKYAVTWIPDHRKPKRQSILRLHNLINPPPRGLLNDHINFDGLDCRKKNLRHITFAQNTQHRRGRKNSLSGFRGVSWHPQNKVWQVIYNKDKKRMYLGTYKDKKHAARVYDDAAKKLDPLHISILPSQL